MTDADSKLTGRDFVLFSFSFFAAVVPPCQPLSAQPRPHHFFFSFYNRRAVSQRRRRVCIPEKAKSRQKRRFDSSDTPEGHPGCAKVVSKEPPSHRRCEKMGRKVCDGERERESENPWEEMEVQRGEMEG